MGLTVAMVLKLIPVIVDWACIHVSVICKRECGKEELCEVTASAIS